MKRKQIFARILWVIQIPLQVVLQQKGLKENFKKEEKKILDEKEQMSFPDKTSEVLLQEEPVIQEKKDCKVKVLTTISDSKKEKEESSLKRDFSKEEIVMKKKENKLQEEMISLSRKKEFPKTGSDFLYQKQKKSRRKYALKEEEVESIITIGVRKKVEETLSSILDERRRSLNKLILSYNQVHQAFEKTEEEKEVSILLEQAKEILIKLESLQKEIKDLSKSGNIEANSNLEEVMIKEIEQLNGFSKEMILSFVEKENQYKILLTKMEELEEKRENLEQRLEEKKELIQNRDQKFYEMNEKTDEILAFENRLYKSCIELDQIALDLEKKAAEKIQVTEKVKYKFDFATKASIMLLTYMTVAKKTKGPKSIGMSLLAGFLALKVGQELVRGKQEISYVKAYTDYSKEISSALFKVEDMKVLLKKSISEVEDLEKEFEKQFGDYLIINKEYQKVFYSLLSVKESLKEKEKLLIEEEQSLNKSAEVTKEKVYQLKQ